MKKFLLKTSVYFVSLLVFLISYALFCDYLFKERNYYLGNSKRYWQLSQKDKKFDYLVLGSSRAYASIDISLLDSIIEKRGINLGLDGSGFIENFVALKLFLKNGNKVDSIFLQVDPYSLMSESSFSNSFHTYAYLPFWDTDKEIKNVLHDNISLIKNWPFYPALLTYFIYNNYYSPYNIYKGLKNNGQFCSREFDCYNGNKIFDSSTVNHNIQGREIIITADIKDIFYYYKILSLAKENNIKLISYMAPTLNSFSNFESVHILKNINYTPPNFEMWNPDFFSDATHVNKLGREMFTLEFGQFLRK